MYPLVKNREETPEYDFAEETVTDTDKHFFVFQRFNVELEKIIQLCNYTVPCEHVSCSKSSVAFLLLVKVKGTPFAVCEVRLLITRLNAFPVDRL